MTTTARFETLTCRQARFVLDALSLACRRDEQNMALRALRARWDAYLSVHFDLVDEAVEIRFLREQFGFDGHAILTVLQPAQNLLNELAPAVPVEASDALALNDARLTVLRERDAPAAEALEWAVLWGWTHEETANLHRRLFAWRGDRPLFRQARSVYGEV